MDFEQAGWASDAFKPVAGQTQVFFRKVQRENAFKTTAAGRPIFDEVIHIVKIPADPKLRIDRPVRPAEKIQYAKEWAAFEATGESRVLGIPIEHWPHISDTQKAEFKAMKIYTVEQFATLPDSYGNSIMDFQNLRNKARVYVTAGQDAELVAKIKQEASAEVAKMREEMAEMRAMLEAATAPQKVSA